MRIGAHRAGVAERLAVVRAVHHVTAAAAAGQPGHARVHERNVLVGGGHPRGRGHDKWLGLHKNAFERRRSVGHVTHGATQESGGRLLVPREVGLPVGREEGRVADELAERRLDGRRRGGPCALALGLRGCCCIVGLSLDGRATELLLLGLPFALCLFIHVLDELVERLAKEGRCGPDVEERVASLLAAGDVLERGPGRRRRGPC